jgi:hypothetical protein
VPLCQVKGHESRSDERGNAPGLPLAEDRRLGEACRDCSFSDRCTGFWRLYLDRWGETELAPYSGEVPA